MTTIDWDERQCAVGETFTDSLTEWGDRYIKTTIYADGATVNAYEYEARVHTVNVAKAPSITERRKGLSYSDRLQVAHDEARRHTKPPPERAPTSWRTTPVVNVVDMLSHTSVQLVHGAVLDDIVVHRKPSQIDRLLNRCYERRIASAVATMERKARAMVKRRRKVVAAMPQYIMNHGKFSHWLTKRDDGLTGEYSTVEWPGNDEFQRLVDAGVVSDMPMFMGW